MGRRPRSLGAGDMLAMYRQQELFIMEATTIGLDV
jgi:hypothetical protein